MSLVCGSHMCGYPWVIHSATSWAMPGPSLIHTAAALHRLRDLHRLAEHRHRVGRERQQAVDRVADLGRLEDLAHQLERASSCGSKSSAVNGSSVGLSADSSFDGMSSGWWKIGRWAYDPTSIEPADWRS